MTRDRKPATQRTQEAEQPEARRKRLTLSEVAERLLSRSASDRSHVLLARNARGETQVEVRVSVSEHGDIQTVEEAEARALVVYDRLAALYPAREPLEQTTVQCTRNAKGETQIEVQVRGGEAGEVRTPEAVTERVIDLYDRMRMRYPMSDGYTAKPGSVASVPAGRNG